MGQGVDNVLENGNIGLGLKRQVWGLSLSFFSSRKSEFAGSRTDSPLGEEAKLMIIKEVFGSMKFKLMHITFRRKHFFCNCVCSMQVFTSSIK